MKLIAPDYFPRFSCIAGACRHSCCIGWEIDIDEDTREYYRTVPGEIGQRLADNIVDGEETACFRLGEGERCPFLNKDNLCDLILTLGEESLCQICDDHPRFKNFFADRTEIGLGLCCEAAGKLILFQKEPVRLTETENDGEDDLPDEDETDLLALRDALTGIAQNRSLPIEARIEEIFDRSGLNPDRAPAHWAEFLKTLERLDKAWTAQLDILAGAQKPSLSPEWEIPFEQLLTYLLYRHMPGAMDDGDVPGRIAFCALITELLRTLFAAQPSQNEETLIELARLFSSEIEYSDENIEAILDKLHTT